MVETIIRYTCECCHAKFDRPKGQESPLGELVIPVVSYDEIGYYTGICAERIMVCPECMKVIEKAISTSLDIRYQSYAGLICKLRKGADNAAD